jgi:hypothetical protein
LAGGALRTKNCIATDWLRHGSRRRQGSDPYWCRDGTNGSYLGRGGARVVLTDINDEKGGRIADDISRSGGDAIYLHHNVADENACPGILVDNAGVGEGGPPRRKPTSIMIFPHVIGYAGKIRGIMRSSTRAARHAQVDPRAIRRRQCGNWA